MKVDAGDVLLARDGAPKAVVIGAGFGGLAAAIRLATLGWRVEIVERLDQPGGRASVLRTDGFTFDMGPTIVTVPHLFEELWTLAGRRMADDVTLQALDPFYRIRFDDGTHFDYNGDPDHMRAEVARFSPGDVAGYDRFMVEAERCYRVGFEELGAVAFDSLRDLIAAVPALVKMRSWRTIRAMVERHLRDPKLRIVFSFHPLLIGGNPSSVTCTYSLINMLERRFGVHWAVGGTGSLVRGLTGLLGPLGVRLRCGATVDRIAV
ncbi:MAG: phytoene desaturase family protein, partial [Burkholderiales bacterium]|nr:phytoene desaturase family protein [Burkholderiales bacterium]